MTGEGGRGIGTVLKRLWRARGGNVATFFALSILPMVLMLGGTADYLVVVEARTKLNAAADAAALSAVSKTAMGQSTSSAQTLANSIFSAQVAAADVAGWVKTKTPTVTDSGTDRTSIYAYTAEVPTSFLGLAGLSKVAISGSSKAAASLPTYMDFYLLLDNTPSMGVAATTAGINTMVANTPDQCAFACHDMSTTPNDYYGLAKRLGVTTRIDVVRTATQQLMDTATSSQLVSNQFRMAIYSFGSSGTARGLTTVAALTSNLSSAKTSAGALDLMTVPYQGHDNDQYTDYDGVFSAVNTAIPNPGTGISASATPQKVLFFVSDGVADAYYPTTCTGGSAVGGGRCQEPMNVANCTRIKNRGIKIAVLYTAYLPLPTNWWYVNTVAPWSSSIATNMQSCASPGLFFEVSPTGGIADAMNALFKKAVQQARLTN
jgi:Flp pilus assembly protein TadG